MKFHSADDRMRFLAEVSRMDLSRDPNLPIPTDVLEGFFKKRRELITPLKDFRKSQNAKAAWRRNRPSYMSGIRTFHRSTKGKRFHRDMSRFMTSRDAQGEALEPSLNPDSISFLKALSSASTHALIELEYFHPVDEEIDYSIFLEDFLPSLAMVSSGFISKTPFSKDHIDSLANAIEPDVLLEEATLVFPERKDLLQKFFNEMTLNPNGNHSLISLTASGAISSPQG
jgi:hypothetical protein